MKILLMGILLTLITGCSSFRGAGEQSYQLYFLAGGQGVPTGSAYTTMSYAPTVPTQDVPATLIRELLLLSAQFGNSAFPAGTSLSQVMVTEEGVAKVYFSVEYRELAGVEKILADYSVVLTLTQLPEISGVAVFTTGAPYLEQDPPVLRATDLVVPEPRPSFPDGR